MFKIGEKMLEEKLQILGIYQQEIIFRSADGHLGKMSKMDYIAQYMVETGEKDGSKVNELLNSIPQLFSA